MLALIKEFSFRTRELGSPLETVKSLETLLKKIHNKEPISNHDKLSLKQIGSIEMFLKLETAMSLIEHLGLDKKDPVFKELKETYRRGNLVFGQIDKKLDRYSNYKAGDLVFTDKGKFKQFRNEHLQLSDRVTNFLLKSPLHHAAVCLKGKSDNSQSTEDQLSHVMQSHGRDDFDLRNKCISSVYRLDPQKMLTENETALSLLVEIYGAEGMTEGLQKEYQKIQQTLHNDLEKQFESIVNDSARKQKSGLAEVFSSMHSKTKAPGRFSRLHQKFYTPNADFKDKKMICSEFAAKTMLAGLIQEQAVIKGKMVKFLVEKKGMKTEVAEKMINDMEIFKLPIPENERLSTINPTRLLELLSDSQCIARVEHQPLIKALIKEEDLAIDPKEAVIPATTTTGFSSGEMHLQEMKPVDLSHLEEVVDKTPNSPPENPTINDKLMNLDGGIVKNKYKFLEKEGIHFQKIKERRTEIKEQKEKWKAEVDSKLPTDTAVRVKKLEQEGNIKALEGGMGGAYLLNDAAGHPRYVLKPSDEDVLALNNRKCKATLASGKSIAIMERLRRGIPLYTTVQAEVLAYRVAADLGFAHITPHTDMVIFRSDGFHDMMDNVEEAKGENGAKVLEEVGGPPDKEKLCSVQEFVPNSIELLDLLNSITTRANNEDLTGSQKGDILMRAIDQKDVEDCILYACFVGEADGNCGNYRLQQKGVDERGDPTYKMVKVDNALTFSESNEDFNIFLDELPQAREGLSEAAKDQIRALTEEKMDSIIQKMRDLGRSEKAVEAFKKRVVILKQCAAIEDVTLAELCNAVKTSVIPRKGPISEKQTMVRREVASTTFVNNDEAATTFIANDEAATTFIPKNEAATTFIAKDEAATTFIQKDDAKDEDQ